MIFVIISLHKSARRTRKDKMSLKDYSRPIAFCLLFLVIFLFVDLYNITLKFEESDYEASAAEWIECLLTQERSNCPSGPKRRPDVGHWGGLHIVVACQGILCFVLYGTMPGNLDLWCTWLSGGGTAGSHVISSNRDSKSAAKGQSSQKEVRSRGPHGSRTTANRVALKSTGGGADTMAVEMSLAVDGQSQLTIRDQHMNTSSRNDASVEEEEVEEQAAPRETSI